VSILSLCFLLKTLIYLWNFSGTSFFASVSDFATFSFSSYISHSSDTFFISIVLFFFVFFFLLWQPLITKTNDHTSGKSLKLDIKWEVHKRTQQGTTTVFYQLFIYSPHNPYYDLSMPTLMFMPCPHVYYSSTMHLPQGQHVVYMCPDIILFNLHHTCMHHVYTMRNPCSLMSLLL